MHRGLWALSIPIWVSAAPLRGQDSSLAITNVTIIDGTGAAPKPNMAVLVRDGRIAEVVTALEHADVEGRSLRRRTGEVSDPRPLGDARAPQSMWPFGVLGVSVANGVTGVRDMGGNFARLLDRRRQIEAGTLTGPRVKLAGPILESPRFLQMIARFEQNVGTPPEESIGAERIGVGSPEDAARAVDSIARLGADFVKIRTVANPATYFAILREAKRAGLPVAGHTPYGMDPATVADSGQKSMEHGFFPPLQARRSRPEDVVRQVRRQRAVGGSHARGGKFRQHTGQRGLLDPERHPRPVGAAAPVRTEAADRGLAARRRHEEG